MITMPEDDGKNQTFKQMGEFEMDEKKKQKKKREKCMRGPKEDLDEGTEE